MDEKLLYTLSSKFKRHKIEFDYDSNSKSIIIGKTKNTTQQILAGITIICIGLALAGYFRGLEYKAVKFFFILIAGTGALFITNAIKLTANIGSKKIITPNYIQFNYKNNIQKYNKEEIIDINYKINTHNETYNGYIYLTIDNINEVKIITLIGDNEKYLMDDFIYLIDVFKSHLNFVK